MSQVSYQLLYRAISKTNRADQRISASIGSVALWLKSFLPVKAYILRPYMYFLSTTLAPKIEVATPYKVLVFAKDFRLSASLNTARA